MTAQEVYEKAMAVSEEQKSMHAAMDIDQLIKVPSQELEMDKQNKNGHGYGHGPTGNVSEDEHGHGRARRNGHGNVYD